MRNKKIPNPDGRKGGEKHQNLIKKIVKYLQDRGFITKTEAYVKIENGRGRFLDILAMDIEGTPSELHQIGKQNKNGEPVARERKAIQEIEKATGKKVFFHAYNILKLFIFIIFVASLVILVSSMN